jgi:hypothetical protein
MKIKIHLNPEFCGKLRDPIHFSAHMEQNPSTEFEDLIITLEEMNHKTRVYNQKKKKKDLQTNKNVIVFSGNIKFCLHGIVSKRFL